jgi:serine/threonine-protein phosphatase 2A regulatory subunit B''
MDYKTFLDFVLAMENMGSVQGTSYFFSILDVKRRGHITIYDVNYFFRVRASPCAPWSVE